MASNYYSDFPEKKVSGGPAPKQKKAGSSPAIVFKAGPFPGLPGKGQPRDRSLGVKKIKQYNRSEGL